MSRMMRAQPLTTVGGLVFGLLLPGTAGAQANLTLAEAPGAGRYASAVDGARLLIDSLMRANQIPGLSMAVSVRDEVVWSEGFGYADLELESPVTTTTRFRIGSISKSLTATALAQLYEQGALDFDAPVQRYVPTFPQKRWPLTVRQVAGHIAGVRHYASDAEFLLNRRFETVQEGLQLFQGDTLLFEPGTQYLYSTFGWNLLSAVVEHASGEEFLSYMREHVFRPLRMRHTVADHVDSIVTGRTRFYVRAQDGVLVNAPAVDNSYKWAGGGFLSTPEDLLLFANAHLGSAFLRPETVTLLWTPQRTADGRETGYGIGWRAAEIRGHQVVSHSGGSVGGNCLLLIYPDARVALAVTANISNAGYGRVAHRIAELFLTAMPTGPGEESG
ncbi:MAG: beta-lactamase family protein [Gemmatimonadota bacterium]|nr:beta-lactamase family protein [Gemmatimonadota bacterium]MDH3367124.1 beta-lactamase family protein [Gemmatimonadota bacterium]MDH3476704.1 beta-lactamase family protein [Gemmatimonadota bacterium]MDH5549646.1 beta-lactamase family protein [Gemmatimonadota bacterium]